MPIPGLRIDEHQALPVYRQIANGIREAAGDGRLPPGHRLPPTRDLARQLGVNRNTVIAAYEFLASEGVVESHMGKGTFLTAPGNGGASVTEPAAAPDTWFTAFSRAVEGPGVGGLLSMYRLATSEEGISFAGSYPAAELMPVEAIGRALAIALRERGERLLGYGPTAGDVPLREALAEQLHRRGVPVGAEDVLITNGAQQAIELVFRTFVERGDAVVTEEPTYTGALSVLHSIGARVVGVPLDEEGIRTDLLALALERHRPRLLYVQPTFHNPTSAVMSLARRRELLELAQRHRCPVVEDDWGGDLRFEGPELPTLHALDGGRHVIYLSTFSKKLLPGLRLGWIAAPPPVVARLTALKQIEDNGTSPLLQGALHAFLRDGGIDTHLDRVRPAYRQRRDSMLAALERHFPEQARWTRPTGGLFLWVTLPADFDANALAVASQRRGVLFSRGELFHANGGGRHTLRLTYSAASPEQIESGVATLGGLVQELWPGRLEPFRTRAIEAMPIL